MIRRNDNQHEKAFLEGQTDQKLFDSYSYGPVNVKDTVGTVFLGILAILLFYALQQSRKRFDELLEMNRRNTSDTWRNVR